MNRVMRIFAMAILMVGFFAARAQQPVQQSVDPNAPSLTLEEKITLSTDDIKKADVTEKAQKAYLEALKPIQEHQDAAKLAIEKDHPGWALTFDQTGWHFVKKSDPKPADKPKTPDTPKK